MNPGLALLLSTSVTRHRIAAPPSRKSHAVATSKKPLSYFDVPRSPKHVSKGEDELCSLNASNSSLGEILPILCAQSGLNIILVGGISNKITFRVDNMRLGDILHHLCVLSGMDYLYAEGAYVVAPPDTLKAAYPKEWLALHPEKTAPPVPPDEKPAPPEQISTTYRTNNIKASDLADSLKKLYPNDLIVAVGPASADPQLTNVSTDSTTGQTANNVSTTTTGSADTGVVSRTVMLHGPKKLVEEALDMIKRIDVPRRQVSIQVTVHDISDDAVRDLGLSWNFSNLTLNETPAANGITFGKFTRDPMTFDATIAALETKDVARLLAAPNVSLLDGEHAFILIGDKISYPQLIGYSSTNSPIFSVSTERVGIYLQVAANIASDGMITLTLYPQVSSITGYLTVNGASYPQVSSREAQTTLMVKPGETVVLGGLLQDQDIVNDDSVPILSKIPLLGEIFKHRKKTRSKSQIIITIRPSLTLPAPPK